jgi:hypothetical protein
VLRDECFLIHQGMDFRYFKWGNACGGVRNFSGKAFSSPGGLPNWGSQLKFGHAYSLVIFFDWIFWDYLKTFFLPLRNWIENNLWIFEGTKSLIKLSKIHSQRKSQKGKRLPIWVPSITWNSFIHELADLTTCVAQNTYWKLILNYQYSYN